ncbi:MAG: acylphosphatase [bacterium]|nr:acylphosphatase [bacterium]
MAPTLSAIRIYISGLVQGVYFRATCQQEARQLGIKGWVRNLPDGRVEVYALGEDKDLEELKKWCRKGPSGSRVDTVQTSEDQIEEGLHNFKILY